ncbi:MAG: cysteine synthase A [Erysipelotrichaceae bacterium]|nr:cysteine synthase A [Erysipelotrichaceae bacterium]
MIYKNAKEMIGNTPVYLLEENGSHIYIKLEKYNPAGSIKDRAVLGMLEDALRQGTLHATDTLIEATSGNTGIALAMLGAVLQIPVVIVMPETMSLERRSLIKAYGAELVLTEGTKGMQGSIDKMEELMRENSHYKTLGQFTNPANPEYHYQTTGQEILQDIPEVEVFVAGIGTGGTLSGVGKALKQKNKDIKVIGVEPASSPLITKNTTGPHKIQGIGANFIPENLIREYVDAYMTITNEEAMAEAVAFARKTGILVGISSGSNIAAAKKLTDQYTHIVTVAPDGGEKYISGGLYD